MGAISHIQIESYTHSMRGNPCLIQKPVSWKVIGFCPGFPVGGKVTAIVLLNGYVCQ
jgi:hypothetical protein